jgi:hypothetical protein
VEASGLHPSGRVADGPGHPAPGVPDPDRPQGFRAMTMPVALGVVAVLVAAGAMYAWRQGTITDARSEAATVRRQLSVSGTRVTALEAEISRARDALSAARDEVQRTRAELSATRKRLRAAGDRSTHLSGRIQDLQGRLGETQAALRAAEADAATARQQLIRLAGRPLDDGTYRVRMLAAQVAAEPPRVLVAQPFPSGEWRLLAVVPGTGVSIARPATGKRTTVPLARFGKMLRRPVLQRTSIKTFPYAIAVVNGRVAQIVQKLPAAG